MESFQHLIAGFGSAISLVNLLYATFGVFVGQIIGVLPGLGPITGLSLLVPLVFGMEPTSALIMLCGVYYGSFFGGAITSILLNTPGDAAAVVTTFDGYPMARQGQAGRALGIAALSSFIGGTISVLGLTFVMPIMSKAALLFGPAEYTMLIIMAFLAVLTFSSTSKTKAVISALIGLVIATVGQDQISGQPRFTFGIFELFNGFDFALVAIGLFAVGEVLLRVEEIHHEGEQKAAKFTRAFVTIEDTKRIAKPTFVSSVLGFVVGILPGAGATIAAFMSYGLVKSISKNKDEFGKGAPEGIAAPESANNASVGGAMVPMLALGVPGSGSTAVLLGAMMVLGLNPGPLFMTESPGVAWGVIASMYIGNVILLIMNIPMIRLFASVLYLPYSYIALGVLVLSFVGAYSIQNSMFDVYLMLGAGLVGYLMKKNDFPLAPLILTLVLGGLLEGNFRKSLLTSDGSYGIFFGSVTALLIWGLILLALLTPTLLKGKQSMLKKPGA
jgi:putative tricarboxylic transport membrane protein